MVSRSVKLLDIIYTALLLLTPLIVVPWASELFEFNKMLFVITTASFSTFIIIITFLAKGKLKIRRTPWDIPLFLFLLSQILSTIFSIDRHTSIWGYYSRFHGGLISTVAYLALYLGLNNLLASRDDPSSVNRSFVRIIILSATLVTIYGFLQHPTPLFRNPSDGSWRGIDAGRWIQNVEERVFSSLGQPNWLAAYLAMTIPFTWYLLLKPRSCLTQASKPQPKALVGKIRQRLSALQHSLLLRTAPYFFLSLLMFWVLLFTKSRAGLAGFSASLTTFIAIACLWKRKLNLKRISWLQLSLLVTGYLVIFVISGKPLLRRFGFSFAVNEAVATASPGPAPSATKTTTPLIPDDTDVIRSIVWPGALTIFKHYPFFGSGVETFAYSYWQFRPAAHNQTSEWEFLYNRAHNEYLNILATTGLFGFSAYALLVIVYLFWTLKQLSRPTPVLATLDHLLLTTLLSGFSAGLVAHFWGFSVVTTALLFFLYPALSFSLDRQKRPLTLNLKLGKIKRPAQLVVTVGFIFVLTQLGKVFLADLFFAQGSQASQIGDYYSSYYPLKLATRLRPDEPIYHDNLAFTSSMLATTTSDLTKASSYAIEAVTESQQALKLGLVNVNYWKTAARVFSELATLDPSVYEQALLALDQAQALAPTDPKLPYNRGLILLQQATIDDPDFLTKGEDGETIPEATVQEALDSFDAAIKLKPDYRDARYALAVTEHELAVNEKGRIINQERLNIALEQLKIILETTQPPDYEAGQKLKEWSDGLPEVGSR